MNAIRSIFRSRDLRYTDTEILFLSTFLSPRPLHDSVYVSEEEWANLLANTPRDTLDRFLQDNLVEAAEPHVTLLAVASAQEISKLAHLLQVKSEESIYQTAKSIVKALSNHPARYSRLLGEPVYICTSLGRSIATDFVAKAGIRPINTRACKPSSEFVVDVRKAVKWLLAAAAAGVVGNRTDALFIELQHERIRADFGAGADGAQPDDSSHGDAPMESSHPATRDSSPLPRYERGATQKPEQGTRDTARSPDDRVHDFNDDRISTRHDAKQAQNSQSSNDKTVDDFIEHLSTWWHRD